MANLYSLFMILKRLALLLMLFGFGLRVGGLSFQPLWGDEGWSFYFAAMPLDDMVFETARDIHPPFYYLLLHIWLTVSGGGPEIARFLSVTFGVLLVAVGYVFGRALPAWNGQNQSAQARLGLAVAGVIALAPMAVYYSQEVRMYGLAALLGLTSALFWGRLVQGQRRAFWPYVISATLLLYTHYFSAFVPAAHGLHGLLRFRKLAKPVRRRLFTALTVSGGLYLPWLLYAGAQLTSYVENKIVIEAYTPLALWQFLGSYLSTFSLGHPSQGWVLWLAVAFIAVALPGGWFIWRGQKRPVQAGLLLGLYLAVPLLLGWLVNLISPFTPRFFERTLLVAAPAWWAMIGAGLLWLYQRRRRWGYAIAGLLAALSLLSLQDFYQVARYPEEDYRPLLAQISAVASPDDVLLASYQWQLGYYHAYLPEPRPTLYPAPGWGAVWGADPARMRADLSNLLAHNIWFPAHQTLGRSWETEAEAVLAELGYPALQRWYGEHTKLSLVGAEMPVRADGAFNFEDKLQATAHLPKPGSFESGRGIIPLEIVWTKLADLDGEHVVTLKLVDEDGNIWVTRDSLPRAAQASFSQMKPGERLPDRHGLLITPGTPPGSYDLRLSITRQADDRPLDLYNDAGQPQGAEAMLAQVSVVEPALPLSPEALPAQTKINVPFAAQVRLVGFSVGGWTAKPGDELPVNLFWQSLSNNLPDLTMFVQLQDATGQAMALTERPPVYPTTAWSTKTSLRDLHKLRLPATIPPGTYQLAAGILLPDKTRLQTSQGDQLVLGQVTVEARPHILDPPQPQVAVNADFSGSATLVGYDLDYPAQPKPGDAITLTLYWQGGAGFDRSWTIFAHLVDAEGHIWGQQDQLPGGGEFPTTSWVPGEYIADTRNIQFKSDAPPGAYAIKVGLYDANSPTFERAPVAGGDTVLLETIIDLTAN